MKPVTGNITGYRLTGNRLTTLGSGLGIGFGWGTCKTDLWNDLSEELRFVNKCGNV